MAKFTGADCRLCRREGAKLFLKGERCYSNKCAIVARPVAPGQHGSGRKKVSSHGIQLREKQKTKRTYGLLEKQFHGYYTKAAKMRGVTGEIMLRLIESRLDNVVYRMGIGSSRAQARQLVNHAHVTVNGKTVNIPSYIVSAGDVIAIKENKRENTYFAALKDSKVLNVPKWLTFDPSTLSGTVVKLPDREDISPTIKEHMIIEFYSK
jgi:small subunit ribosomal protein S4